MKMRKKDAWRHRRLLERDALILVINSARVGEETSREATRLLNE
ncbi:hypothetical protein FACS189491_07520 [Spirochaetia bacterium]|nr:hypothetical protein FACS189491_07520 [Spirochaetia bacterium]